MESLIAAVREQDGAARFLARPGGFDPPTMSRTSAATGNDEEIFLPLSGAFCRRA
ncbi:hypothetical protein ACIP79_39910 [Streptomyces sp. NPDC088747]|uniref:hypothetical protein n=1 Tax=Streptomyces sp. NPDC088747 TaxID=3365886 RepID=UPI0037FAA183